MEINCFARIGKGVLSKAIGLQKNYKYIVVSGPDNLDEIESGCFDCPTPGTVPGSQFCNGCPQAVYKHTRKLKTIYVNERNRYGYQPTLKSTSIKLLILYHFLQPDGNGFIRNLPIKDLASRIGCAPATIRTCNKILQQYGYCYVSNSGIYENCINVLLPEYKDYHKTASEGGRGYITMSDDMLVKILSIKGLNPLRLSLKGILEIDNARIGRSECTCASTSFQRLRGFLPRYCKNNVIRSALALISPLLDTSYTEKNVTFKIKDTFSPQKIRKELVALNQVRIEDYVSKLNDNIEKYAELCGGADAEGLDYVRSSLTSLGISISRDMPLISLSLSDYTDLASLSIQFNIHMVMDAVRNIYNSYIIGRTPIDSFGALARTFIKNRSFQLAS